VFDVVRANAPAASSRTPQRLTWRWDKSVLSESYESSRVHLTSVPRYDLDSCGEHCDNPLHRSLIDGLYHDITSALYDAAVSSVVRLPIRSLKPFWNDELDRLKEAAILWHDIWCSAGKPKSGQVFSIKCSAKLRYKLAIREPYDAFEKQHDEELYEHFLHKRQTEFWKSWNSKFRRKLSHDITIDGCHDSTDIANKFAEHFQSVYEEASSYNEAYGQDASTSAKGSIHGENVAVGHLVTVELIESCISKLALGKACGPDELSAEHLVHAHPSVVVALCQLFRLIIAHRYVPEGFGQGTIVPLVKDKSHNLNDVDNYRAITLIPIVSKVFESVILKLCEHVFTVDDLQFGFKHGVGCSDAIFALKTTVAYFNKRGSSVFLAALDIKKAFDSVNHNKLFKCLSDAGLPESLVAVLGNWYSKLFVNVRWANSYSYAFPVICGVRQGSILSPAMFNVFMNIFICRLRLLGFGCHLASRFVGCLLYADDMIMLCPSVIGLQKMLDVCVEVADVLSLKFNANKSYCIAVGKYFNKPVTDMNLGSSVIHWVDSIKYLGVYIRNGVALTFDTDAIRRSFFAACNCIFTNSRHCNELIQLSLQESYSLPILTYRRSRIQLW
jgi:Reverse transcriptase (RNA-dependent DNA polymerase)